MTRAAILEAAPGELVVDDIEVGDVGPGEVLVQTVAAGLCHSDLHFIQGLYPYPLPAVLGHESAGIVEAVGDDVTDFSVGDHVVDVARPICTPPPYTGTATRDARAEIAGANPARS